MYQGALVHSVKGTGTDRSGAANRKQLTLHREFIAVCAGIHKKKHRYTMCGHKVEILDVKPDGAARTASIV